MSDPFVERWRNGLREEVMGRPPPPACRCKGTGIVRYFGKAPDGRKGPCPRCHVEGAQRFIHYNNPFGRFL